MFKTALILAAFVIAIGMPWLIVSTDMTTAIHTLPAGWSVRLFHSNVVMHSPRNHPYYFSLKDVFVGFAVLVLIGLITLAAIRQRRLAARGFEIEQQSGNGQAPLQQSDTPAQS